MLPDYGNPYEVARRLRDDELISLQLVHAAADLLVSQADRLRRAASGKWQEVRNEMISELLKKQTERVQQMTPEEARAYLKELYGDSEKEF